MIADWLGLMEPARGESFPSGQRRGPAVPGVDRVSCPDQKSFHISTTKPNTWGTKTGSPGSTPPRTVWKPQPHRLVADWLGLVESVGGERCPSDQGRGRAAHGEAKVNVQITTLCMGIAATLDTIMQYGTGRTTVQIDYRVSRLLTLYRYYY